MTLHPGDNFPESPAPAPETEGQALRPAPARRGRDVVKSAVFSLIVLIFTLALLEIAVRLIWPPLQTRGPFEQPPEQVTGRDVSVFQSDPLLFWRLRPNVRGENWDYTTVSTNSLGLRYGEIRPKAALARETGRPVFRILCVGDSVTFGYRTPAGSTFSAVLERTLRAAFPATHWEVIPLACPGYSTLQSYHHLEQRIGTLEPDFLILNSGWNDVQLTAYPDRLVFDESRALRSAHGWLRRSQLYLRMRRWLLNSKAPAPVERQGPTRRVSRDDYTDNMMRMAALGRRRGALSLVLGPFYQKLDPPDDVTAAIPLYRQALAEACARENVPFLSLPFLTEQGWPLNKEYFGEAVHPNDRGHYIIARETLKWLLRHDVLPIQQDDKPRAAIFDVYGPLEPDAIERELDDDHAPPPVNTTGATPPAGEDTPVFRIRSADAPPPDAPLQSGLLRYLYNGPAWKGPLLQVMPVGDINHTLEEWKGLEDRPLVPAFSMRWEGWLQVPESGEWSIGTSSDDGSLVFLDGELWLDNGGAHGPGPKLRHGSLEAGLHRLAVYYNDYGYGAEMRLLWARPGQPPAPVPAGHLKFLLK
ncbi:MAG: hypothetical protein Kow0059_16720 [Candidatus Sumerlaeia bacterium]